jgi:DNA-binding transcriptional regulator YiaG
MTTDTKTMWTERVAAWRASGMTVAEYADKLGVHPSTLRNWERRTEKHMATRSEEKASSLKMVSLVRKVPLMTSAAAVKAAPVVIEIGGARLLVTADADERALSLALRVLGAQR